MVTLVTRTLCFRFLRALLRVVEYFLHVDVDFVMRMLCYRLAVGLSGLMPISCMLMLIFVMPSFAIIWGRSSRVKKHSYCMLTLIFVVPNFAIIWG